MAMVAHINKVSVMVSYPARIFCSGASRAGIGRPGTLCIGAVGHSAAVRCVRVCVCVFREVNYKHFSCTLEKLNDLF